MIDDDAEEVRVEAEKKKTRTGHRRKFPLDILKFGYNKRSYDLSFRQQQNRTNVVSQQILASCVDQKELKETGMEYIEKNMALALDVVTFDSFYFYEAANVWVDNKRPSSNGGKRS